MQCKKCNGPTVKKALFSSFYEHCDKCDSGDKLIAGQVRNAVKEHIETMRKQFNQMNAAATNAWKQPTYAMPNASNTALTTFSIGDEVIWQNKSIYRVMGERRKTTIYGGKSSITYDICAIGGTKCEYGVDGKDLVLYGKSPNHVQNPKALYSIGEQVFYATAGLTSAFYTVRSRYYNIYLNKWLYVLANTTTSIQDVMETDIVSLPTLALPPTP